MSCPGQAVATRQKDKVVLLPGDAPGTPPAANAGLGSLQEEGDEVAGLDKRAAALSLFEDIDDEALDGSHGRLTVSSLSV